MSETIEVLDRVEVWGSALAGKLEQLALDHGDKAVDLALAAARVDALYTLTIGLIIAIAAIVAGFISNWFRKQAVEAIKTADRYSDAPFGWGLSSALLGAGAAVAGVASLLKLANAWAWAGLFYPELWIAKRVIGL